MAYDYEAARKSGASDDQIIGYLSGRQKYDSAAAMKAGASKQQVIDYLAKNDGATPPPASNPAASTGSMVGDALAGAGSGLIQIPVGIYDLIRKIPGVADHLPEPNAFVRGLTTPPDTLAGHIGRGAEQVAEFAVPMSKVSRLAEAAPIAEKLMAEGLTAGGVSAVQTGGNPDEMAKNAALTVALGGAGAAVPAIAKAVALPVVQKLIDASPRPLSQAAQAIATKYGVPLTRAMQGGSRTVLAAEKMLGHTVAPDLYEPAMEAAQSGLKRGVDDLASGFGVDKFAAGDSTIQKLMAESDGFKNKANGAYTKLRNIEADPANVKTVQVGTKPNPSADPSAPSTIPVTEDIPLPVDMRAAKSQFNAIIDDVTRSIKPAQRESDPGLAAIKSLVSDKDYLPASVAEKNLGYLKSILRSGASDQSKRLASKAIDQLDTAITDAVSQAGPDAVDSLTNARDLWRQHEGVKATVKELAGDVSGKTGQLRLSERLLSPADRSFPALQKVLAISPDAAEDLGKSYLATKVFGNVAQGADFTTPTQARNLWMQMGKRTKDALYSADQQSDVNSFLDLAKRVSENPNPSNSGILQAMLKMGILITHPVQGASGLVMGRNLAKLLYTPDGAVTLKAALQAGSPQSTSKAMVAVKAILNDRSNSGAKP